MAVKGPDWLDDVRVDLVAKAESQQTPEADLRVMMRAVFRDRMKMVARIEEAHLGLRLESKEVPVPVLVIDSMDRTPTDN